MPDRRPLPLVTAEGPLCQAACGLRHTLGPVLAMPGCTMLMYQCELPGGGVVTDASPCHPDEHAAWLREQERAKRTSVTTAAGGSEYSDEERNDG